MDFHLLNKKLISDIPFNERGKPKFTGELCKCEGKEKRYCEFCGRLLPIQKNGFKLNVGDIVEDHCGLKVRVDSVWSEDNHTGWGTTLNGKDSWCRSDHDHHRINTDNEYYEISLWRLVVDE